MISGRVISDPATPSDPRESSSVTRTMLSSSSSPPSANPPYSAGMDSAKHPSSARPGDDVVGDVLVVAVDVLGHRHRPCSSANRRKVWRTISRSSGRWRGPASPVARTRPGELGQELRVAAGRDRVGDVGRARPPRPHSSPGRARARAGRRPRRRRRPAPAPPRWSPRSPQAVSSAAAATADDDRGEVVGDGLVLVDQRRADAAVVLALGREVRGRRGRSRPAARRPARTRARGGTRTASSGDADGQRADR